MTHWMRPADLDRQRELDRFDPVSEGARWGLSRADSLALWERACADAAGSAGRRDEELARQQFRELAIATRAGRAQPGTAGRVTRVAVESGSSSPVAWSRDEQAPRAPGRETLVAFAARPPIAVRSEPGRRTLVDDDAANARLGFDDYRVLGLKDVLQRLGSDHALRRDVVAAAASTDRVIAGRATLWREQPSIGAAPTKDGHALWQAAERHAATLYRRAVTSGLVNPRDPTVGAALQQRGAGERLPRELRRAMERELGVSLAGVRIHTDAMAAQAARALAAAAFTVGEDVFFAEGMFSPDTRAGRHLLAHELAHVAQALHGRVGPARDGLQVSQPGEPLEQEAEAVAARVDTAAAPQRLGASIGEAAPLDGEVSSASPMHTTPRLGLDSRVLRAPSGVEQMALAKGVTRAGADLAKVAAAVGRSEEEVVALLRAAEKQSAQAATVEKWRSTLKAGGKLAPDEVAGLQRMVRQLEADQRVFRAAEEEMGASRILRKGGKLEQTGPVSLKRLRTTLGRSGVSPSGYHLRKATKVDLDALRAAGTDPSNVYAWVSRDGSNIMAMDARGRPVITFTDKGLSSLEEAVKSFGHEAKHIKDFAAGMTTSNEALAEKAGEELWTLVQKKMGQ